MSIISFLFSFSLLIIATSVHEFSHALTAYKLGDTTAKDAGRLTLNPLAHIDLIGTIILPMALFLATSGRWVFGAAKPVPINYYALKNPKQALIWIGLSGPLANFLFAFILSLFWKFIPGTTILSYVIQTLIVINVVLGTFNLLPIPPLDGSRVVMGILPQSLADSYSRIEPFGFPIIMLLSVAGIFDLVLWPAVIAILKFLL